MKTKQILSILAVPALLAACTAENDLLVNNAPELAGRKVLDSEVNIGFVGADQLDSRLSMGETSVTLDSSDKIAAALIDRVKVGAESGAVNGYIITDGIATNHPFTTTNNKDWTTPTQLMEGNYLFYYQYNPALGDSRAGAVPYSIAANQFAYAKDAKTVFVGDQAVKDNAMGIGYAYLGADAEGYTPKDVKVQMYNLFSFLKFNIKTDKTGLEVQQIKVEPVKEAFKLSGKIDNADVATWGIKTADREAATDENPANAGLLVAGEEVAYTSTFATEDATPTTNYIILSLPDLAVNATPQSAYVVIPAKDYANEGANKKAVGEGQNATYPEFKIMVYTNQGVYTEYKELSEVGTEAPYADYASLEMGTVQPMSLNITGTLTAASEYFVGSADEWQKVLNSLPASSADPKTAITINLLNDVELTKADIDLLGSTNADDYKLTVAGGAMVLTESCALNDITINEVTVNSGVVVDLDKNTVITTLNNNGTVDVNAVTGQGNKVASVTTLTNYGVANFETSADVTTLVNGSDAEEADNSAVKVNVNAGVLKVTTLTNNYASAAIAVATGAELQAAGSNAGDIEVDGTFIASGAFSNTGDINAKANSIVTPLNNAAITNLGTIEAAAGSLVKVDDNGDEDTMGVITYNDGADVAVNGTIKGKIAYIITSTYKVPTAKVEYNTIVIDGLNIKLSNGAQTPAADLVTVGITNMVVKNNSNVDASLVPATKLSLIEVEGKNTIVTNATGLNTATLSVKASAYLNIPLYSKITADILINKGRIDVGGALSYTENGSTSGTLLGSGDINI